VFKNEREREREREETITRRKVAAVCKVNGVASHLSI
jgi:hypothetical protein